MFPKRIAGVLAVLLVPMLCVVAGGVTPAAADVQATGPFSGNLQEGFENLPVVDPSGALNDPTSIMGGGASIGNGSMKVYDVNTDPYSLIGANAQAQDGTKGLAVNALGATLTITFTKAVTGVGGYWAAAALDDTPPTFTAAFFDEQGNPIGTEQTWQYNGANGALEWHGWTSTTPIKSMTVLGSLFVVDALQATLPSSGLIQVTLDVDPGSCKNVLHVRGHRWLVAVVRGSQDLDVAQIDTSTLRLVGVAPVRTSIHDTFAIVDPEPGDEVRCHCAITPRDGIPDLVMKFRNSAIVNALQQALGRRLKRGETLTLTLEGMLLDGTPITGQDVVVVRR